MPLAYPYCRVSSDQQTLDQQKQSIEPYYAYKLKPRGFAWVDFTIDPETSGGTEFCQRRGGTVLNSRAKAGDAIIITKLDRAFRNVKDALACLDDWRSRDIELHIIDMGIDTSLPWGRFVYTTIAAFAEMERQQTSVRMKEKYATARRLGNNMGAHPGYGWRWVKNGKSIIAPRQVNGVWMNKTIMERRRKPDIRERQWIVLAAELREQGYSTYETYRIFADARATGDDGKLIANDMNRINQLLKWVSQRQQDTGHNDLDHLWWFGDDSPNTAREPLPRLDLASIPHPKTTWRKRKTYRYNRNRSERQSILPPAPVEDGQIF